MGTAASLLAALSVVAAYSPFVVDYVLYLFWQAVADPYRSLSNAFGWIVLIIMALIVHVALGIKALAVCFAANLDAAESRATRFDFIMGLIACIACFESWPLGLKALIAVLPSEDAVRVSATVEIGVAAAAAGLAVMAMLLVRRIHRRVTISPT